MATPFLDILQTYFAGERATGFGIALPLGLVLMGLAGLHWQGEVGAWRWSLAAPAGVLGLVCVAVGLGLGLKTPGQVAELVSFLDQDPVQMLAVELPRMAKVNANWPILVWMWVVLLVSGLGLRMGIPKDWAHGLGLSLMFIGATGFLIDSFAERRALIYTAGLHALAREQGVAVPGASD